jgi:hypothetical protein
MFVRSGCEAIFFGRPTPFAQALSPFSEWERLLDRMPAAVNEHHHARERSERDEQKAEAIISEGLKKLGWGKRELASRRKSDPEKVPLARAVRCQTAMSLKWIAQRLEMGSWTHVSNLLRQ